MKVLEYVSVGPEESVKISNLGWHFINSTCSAEWCLASYQRMASEKTSMKTVELNCFSCQVSATVYHSSMLPRSVGGPRHQYFRSTYTAVFMLQAPSFKSQSKLYSRSKYTVLPVNTMLFHFLNLDSTYRAYYCRETLNRGLSSTKS